MEQEIRDTANIHPNTYLPKILCFVRSPAQDYSKEMGELKMTYTQNFLHVIQQDRTCDQFTPWKQGFTPKEHAEMLQESDRLKWQAERRKPTVNFERRNQRSPMTVIKKTLN